MSSGAATKDLVLAAVNTKASRIRRFTKEAKTRKVVREALWSREASVTSHVNQGANREELIARKDLVLAGGVLVVSKRNTQTPST